MSSNKTTRTLRCYVHEKERFERMLKSVLKDFPGYIPIQGWHTFNDVPESRGCPKLYIKAYRWHGEWAEPTCDIIRRYFRPNIK